MKKLILFFIILIEFIYADNNYYFQNNQKISLTPKPSSLNKNINFYTNSHGVLVGITDLLIVKLRDNTKLEKYLLHLHLKLNKKLGKDIYLLQTRDKNITLDIANTLSSYTDVVYAHPDFIKTRVKR